MRVIAGDARGRRLEALPGTDITRPTLDQVKEAMFSIVQFDLPAHGCWTCTQAAASSASRPSRAGSTVRVPGREPRGRQHRDEELQDLRRVRPQPCQHRRGGAVSFACREQFDLVLLDPPFHGGTLEKILPSVEKVLAPGGIALCESETGLVLPAEVGSLTLKKQYKYGKVLLWKYTKPMQPAGEEDAE